MKNDSQFMLTVTISSALANAVEEWLMEQSIFNWTLLKENLAQTDYQLQGYFATTEAAITSWSLLRKQFHELPANYDIQKLNTTEWQNAYKAYLKPWFSRGLHWVPLWMRDTYEAEGVAIYLDAGMAFGTGSHETTRLCAERLLDIKTAHTNHLEKLTVIDAGCGSGILSLSAAALGFGIVKGFDVDPDAIQVSQENAVLNGLKDRVHFFQGSLPEGLLPQSADVVLANIQADILCGYSNTLIQSIKGEGTLILSGILVRELTAVETHFCQALQQANKLYTCDSRTQGEWADLSFKIL
jgi:ribosomal protein L11 methyltransferase